MPLFASPRERRLWLWTLAVVTAIFASLGLAGQLAEVLTDSGLIGEAFVFSAFLVLLAVLTQGFRFRPGGVEIAVALGVAAVYILVFLRMGVPVVERTHLVEYSVVAILIHLALKERRDNGRRVPRPALIALAATVLLGALDEGVQAVLPNRVFDIRDIGFNAMAGLMAVSASVVLDWARVWVGKRKDSSSEA